MRGWLIGRLGGLWGLLCLLVCLSLGGLQVQRRRLLQRTQQVAQLHGAVGRAVERLQIRHLRQMQRCRSALLQADAPPAAAMLGWLGARVAADFAAGLQEVDSQLRRLRADGDEAAALACGRLLRQLARLEQQSAPLPALIGRLEGAVRRADAAALRPLQAELESLDSGLLADLWTLADMVHAVAATQAREAVDGPLVWAAVCPLICLLALGWSARPLLRLRRLALDGQARRRDAAGGAAGPLAGPPASREEGAWRAQLAEHGRTRQALGDRLQGAEAQLARLRQGLRRSDRDLLLLRSYNDNLVNSLRSAVLVTDAAGRLSSINRTARDLLGLSDADVGTPLTESRLGQAIDAQDAAGCPATAAAPAQRFEAVAYQIPGHAEPCLLDIRVAPYRDETGTPRGLLVLADDVTEATQIKHQLLRSERLAAVGQLSAQVAHEIRNPLSAIGLNTELLEDELSAHLPPAAGQEARELLRGIGAEIERLTQVTEAYLDMARLPRPQVRRVEVNQVVADLFAMLRPEMQTHRIEVELDLQRPSPQLLVDPGQLRQALLNVVRNSREAMPQGGRLWARTRRLESGGVRIAVEDTGGGISDAVRQRACDPFFSTKPKGSGLGLPLTAQILGQHGGGLELKSFAPPAHPRGTRVTLQFPAA